MAEMLLSVAEPTARPVDPKEHARLARTIEERVADGYRIESLTDLQAVLVKDPNRWLGVARSGREKREIVSINQWGYPRIEQQ